MPASSEKQRKLFGMVLAYKRGKLMHASALVKKVASGVSAQGAKDFASSVIKRAKRKKKKK